MVVAVRVVHVVFTTEELRRREWGAQKPTNANEKPNQLKPYRTNANEAQQLQEKPNKLKRDPRKSDVLKLRHTEIDLGHAIRSKRNIVQNGKMHRKNTP